MNLSTTPMSNWESTLLKISIWPFLMAALLAVVITLLTVSYQSIKAAVANPVDAIRYE
ncbi:MAG TPA: hypothetical protein VFG01_11325 [Acidobacteriota bacterium]|nr:hypothetical protein [Acidobacteriota bacterium]